MDRPETWDSLAQRVVERGRVVLLIGAPDTGKTTLCQFLVRMALEEGLRTAYIDADVGQSVIGPPTTLGMTLLERGELTPYPEPSLLYFIGATSPARHLLPTVAGLRKLLDGSLRRGAEFVVVDTTGLVAGELGFSLKFYKVEALQPTDVVVLEREREVEHILRALRARAKPELHLLLPSPQVIRRDQVQRQSYRLDRFRSYFLEATLREVELSRCVLINPSFPLLGDGGGEERLRGRLIGLIDPEGFALGLGVFLGIKEGRAQLLTPVGRLQDVRALQVGSMAVHGVAHNLSRSETGVS